jgi:cadmium resistance protein CadD (predicted permease)
VIPYLRLLPLLPGIRAAWSTWRQRRFGDHDEELEHETSAGTRIPHVAAVTFANSGDNIGVYVPVFATAGAAGVARYAGCSWSASRCGARPDGSSPPHP